MNKLMIILLSVIFISFSNDVNTLHFITNANYAPFEFISTNNQIQGFDIDIANALCKNMHKICTFTNQSFESLIPSLNYKRCDAVIAGIDITPVRMNEVIFTNSYYTNNAIFITKKDKLFLVKNNMIHKIGTLNGSTYQKYLVDKYPSIKIVAYDSYHNAILDLKSERLDSIFGDAAVINQWLKKDNSLITVGNKITDKSYFGLGFGIAIRKDNNILLANLNHALACIKQDGTYQIIYQKWFQ
ncbi:transporter substrate-binding domain-containing protein [Candidatus Palibaumannia cicadellinicola]|uniref:Arginine ABC-transporter, arginine binding protein n=1 Tax=Baumannia cicadellinicola subsp. Homalodisca coagulata TaxID=374463 RepID=Q1LTE2_BAUCH|nr:transporter substrate-binding domain-containing protein [Candidatus Baumannia cicadellinicola]ABF14045.1 arginine ABC-transporter, arginine binding protein [Baumannia cicadellinicola str. Hc (Homalodisca coagulata)]MCJ7462246.1 transporter substrate-binding domain-containing protein [Candidatus Baumannia cicadellinicola]MCJ7462764.1 transporter substrate-binding domain-containing protein [Candidatus Baumannia cicadellinicola]